VDHKGLSKPRLFTSYHEVSKMGSNFVLDYKPPLLITLNFMCMTTVISKTHTPGLNQRTPSDSYWLLMSGYIYNK